MSLLNQTHTYTRSCYFLNRLHPDRGTMFRYLFLFVMLDLAELKCEKGLELTRSGWKCNCGGFKE